jgi:hypothetical protein
MAKAGKHGLDEPQLEGGIAGAGGASTSIKGTKWSSMPSFKGNASTMGDIKKLTADSSHLKGGAKQAVDEAKARAAKRTAVRAAGAQAAYQGGKAIVGESASSKDSGNKDDGVVEATFRKATEDREEPPEMATHYKPDNYKSGGTTASRRADGIATKGKTRGKIY